MENKDSNTSDFLDDFKTNLYSDEIYVFTPKGDLFTLPKMQLHWTLPSLYIQTLVLVV